MSNRNDSVFSHTFTVQNHLEPRKLSLAISAVLATPAGAALAQEQPDEAAAGALEEIVVTSRKREESMMDIPESIQAISEQDLKLGGLYSMDDYVRFIPSMSYTATNPGSAVLVFRGISDSGENFIAEPTAALYLDEQSLTLNATPDPRMVDIARIEALSGPQGTLYGASAQAGLLRVITNKPDPAAFDSFIDATLKTGSDSDMSYDVSAMVNIPISQNFAIRLVGFSAEDGGFIDNVNGDSVQYGVFNNAGAERKNFNDVEHFGGRIAARWFINEGWTMTAGIVHQDTMSHGRPERDPTLDRDLSVARFRPDREEDDLDWTQYSLTFEGDLGFADFVSATSYFTRDWTYTQDTQTYASYFGTFCYAGYYYDYSNYSPYCFQPAGVGNYYNDPVGYLRNAQKDTKFAQEFRLFSQGERFDWVAGLFYEQADQDWVFDTFADGFDESKSMQNYLAGRVSGSPAATRLPGDAWWRSADDTTWEQWAVFGEFTWHINERWDATVGARWFDREVDKTYYVENPRYNLTDTGVLRLPAKDDDVVPKFSLSFRPTDNILLYGLYSEGFRPGGTNRTRGEPLFPQQFESDLLENLEFGAKMTLADGRVRLNATYFSMDWNNYQLEVIDPSTRSCGSPNAPPEPNCSQPWQKVVGNVGDAGSDGFELQVDWAASQNLTAGFNATWLDSELDDGFNFLTETPPGSRLPLTPEFKGSAYAQYDMPVNWFGGRANNAYARVQWSYVGDMLNQVEPIDSPAPQIKQPSYDIGDLRFGVDGNDWSVQLFVNNVTDERAILYDNPFEFDHFFGKGRQTINRPREYGVRFIKRFGE
ncbi:MAG: TonB-dependent receptor [Xanthomonadales bacterium]|nr:TonB-dependent receptor [Xanthomonadales bacterium]NIN58548.1 TonB-dependent receptor [Xanthomonadales bacterium]NIN73837.1 TonB-dependent receptor [Xanthomonadales bacterium]NIO12306.1 TonB-dependent receptor [Xanthomonadales bacterium]NIP10941.1 TonB-dependent receptor [Xanthomonadales bacterium]